MALRARRSPSATAASAGDDWEMVYRGTRTPRYAMIVAALLVITHVTVGALLRMSNTGVDFRVTDQFGLALIGVVLAGAVLLLTRPRLRVGPAGVAVRNLTDERLFGWDVVGGLWFPQKGRCARLELPGDEYTPVLAIQANDGDLAVAAMDRFRELYQRYSTVG
ncbi:PH domain-containing protein [Williamsia sterculiae]|uniref:PH domain-containing protein n=1 Tax=Williamsia sterculiae TaxID=1344003 RepID=A0A1N7EID1_9NOCA|nr:PH domain-containing protein [Williamsia sterculiae]SIR87922.1 PH domain-containing protein [Williamsia sterculiae]